MRHQSKKYILERYGTVLRIYEYEDSLERYTILPPRWAGGKWKCTHTQWSCVVSGRDPQGHSTWTSAVAGSHLGKRIALWELPAAVQKLARQQFAEFFE